MNYKVQNIKNYLKHKAKIEEFGLIFSIIVSLNFVCSDIIAQITFLFVWFLYHLTFFVVVLYRTYYQIFGYREI